MKSNGQICAKCTKFNNCVKREENKRKMAQGKASIITNCFMFNPKDPNTIVLPPLPEISLKKASVKPKEDPNLCNRCKSLPQCEKELLKNFEYKGRITKTTCYDFVPIEVK